MDGLFYGRLEKVQMVKVPPPLPSLNGKEKERSRRKNVKTKLIVDVNKDILAPVNFILKVAKKTGLTF